ncbi:MAG: ABC transporter ATP-binding protein [Actinomycetota bacterium]|nr:ABC transporter ATP-binding protein [Actinomycetota bacterium]
MSAVVVEGLRKSYGDVEAVRGVSFTVEPGEVFALLGPNGAGKTTTLGVLEGYQERDAGRVEVLGTDPAAGGRALRERVGIVLQDIAVQPYLTVREALRRTAGYYPRPRPIDEVIALVGLGPQAGTRVRRLSGGQQRRLDLALAVVGRPDLLFLDEPTTGFDPSARREAWSLVRDLRDLGTTILLTTHYMDEAQALADRIAVIARGELVAQGTPHTIGGRDTAESVVAFTVADEVQRSAMPLPDGASHVDGAVTVRTTEPVRFLYTLTAWAIRHDVTIEALTVARPSLEDVYLELTEETG